MSRVSFLTVTMTLISIVLAVLFILQMMIWRSRLKKCHKLVPTDKLSSPQYKMLHAPGVPVNDTLTRAASAYMLAKGLDVLELVPRNVSTRAALLFAGTVDPPNARNDIFAKGHTVLHATMVSVDVYKRAKVRDEELADARSYSMLAIRLRRFASRTSSYAVAPWIPIARKSAGPLERALFCTYSDPYSALMAVLDGSILFLLLAGLVANPLVGATVLFVYHIQPLIATIGTGFTPFDLWKHTLLRVPIEIWKFPALVRSVAALNRETDETKGKRDAYKKLLAKGTRPFFEPRQVECPLCKSMMLVRLIRTPDFFQGKPGMFTLERCKKCGHIFQNPRLSMQGLDFYHKDFYEDTGKRGSSFLFGSMLRLYISRAKALSGIHIPVRWLDVGGVGHFCMVARSVWPHTEFDGLAISKNIEEAERAHWVDHGMCGKLPECAETLRGKYDVLSMYHYLERTREPLADLRAANTVLSDGGYLAIEMPNPECPLRWFFRKYWYPWFQPHRQHFFSQANLERLLGKAGFTVLKYDYVQPHQPADVGGVMNFILFRLGKPIYRFPWGPRPVWYRILRTWLVYACGFWLMPLGFLVDALIAPFLKKPRRSNSYRILALKVARPDLTT